MLFSAEVRGGVAIRRAVAAADMTARHAHAEVHPRAPDPKAVLASVAAGGDVGDLVEVTARVRHCWYPSTTPSGRTWESSGSCPVARRARRCRSRSQH